MKRLTCDARLCPQSAEDVPRSGGEDEVVDVCEPQAGQGVDEAAEQEEESPHCDAEPQTGASDQDIGHRVAGRSMGRSPRSLQMERESADLVRCIGHRCSVESLRAAGRVAYRAVGSGVVQRVAGTGQRVLGSEYWVAGTGQRVLCLALLLLPSEFQLFSKESPVPSPDS